MRTIHCLVIASVLSVPAAGLHGKDVSFNTHIRPILADACYHCHGPDTENQDSELRLDNAADATADLGGYAAIVPGDVAASNLVERILSEDADERMPPSSSGRQLTDAEKQLLVQWIRNGAAYEKHWSFQTPRRPAMPAWQAQAAQQNWPAKTIDRWSQHPIDGFVANRLVELNRQPNEPAPPAIQLRRASLTLTGLLPAPAATPANHDNDKDVYADQVERLLHSTAYAEHQTLRWLDAARYADTDGYQNDNERSNWPWRDWVIQAFQNNMRFDQFTLEQLAGDLLPNATNHQRLATAFNRNHRQNGEAGALGPEFRVENTIDRVETTVTVWLGLTMGCCRCHDHKYDPLSQREFYQLYAYFNNIGETGVGRGITAKPLLKTISPLASPKQIAAFKRWQRLQEEIDSRSQDAPSTQNADGGEPSTDDEASTERKQLREQAEATLRRLKAEPVPVMVMAEKQGVPTPAYLLNRGQYDQPELASPLSRGVPAILTDKAHTAPADRLGLAKWLVSDSNPLTARVIINRIWRDHFGQGLVTTENDFGLQGAAPSHPQLLDWLAVEFIESEWDLHHIHRLIVSSQTYRQRSNASDNQIQADPQNRWLARGPRFRLDGFAIRDAALQASGLLDRQVGGPPVKPYQPAGLWASMAANKGTAYQADSGAALYRRSMYTYWKRAVNPPRQTIFDSGGRETCAVSVQRTNTPLQALVLMNDVTFLEAARQLAGKTLHAQGPDASLEDGIQHMLRRALGRPGTEYQCSVLSDSWRYFQQHYGNNQQAAKQLLSHGKSPPIALKHVSVTDQAAWTSVAHLILNMDAFLSVE